MKSLVKNKRGGGTSNFKDFLRPLPSLLIFEKLMNVLSGLSLSYQN